jgi:hypothetical protein
LHRKCLSTSCNGYYLYHCPACHLAYLNCRLPSLLSCRRLNPYGEIGSGNPSMSMMVIGLSLPLLRQRWPCLLYYVYWLPDGCCIWSRDQNTWKTIPESEQKNALNNRTLYNGTLSWIKHWIKQKKTKVEQ